MISLPETIAFMVKAHEGQFDKNGVLISSRICEIQLILKFRYRAVMFTFSPGAQFFNSSV